MNGHSAIVHFIADTEKTAFDYLLLDVRCLKIYSLFYIISVVTVANCWRSITFNYSNKFNNINLLQQSRIRFYLAALRLARIAFSTFY